MPERDATEDADRRESTLALPLKEAAAGGAAPFGKGRPAPSPARPGLSIVLKLTVLVALVLLPAELVLIGAAHRYWQEMVKRETETRLSGLAATRVELVQAQLQILRQRVTMSADRAEFRRFLVAEAEGQQAPDDRNMSDKRLSRVLTDKKTTLAASLLDRKGIVLLSSDASQVGRDLSQQADFRGGLRDSYVSSPRTRGAGYVAMLSAPVLNKEESVGELMMAADFSEVARVVENPLALGETGEVLLITRAPNGSVRTILPSRGGAEISTPPAAKPEELDALMKSPEGFGFMRDYRGQEVLVAGKPVGYSSWWLLAKIDRREAYAPVTESLRWRVMYGGVVALVGLAIAYFLARNFTRPIRRLAEASARVAHGDYLAEVPEGGRDEIGMLSRTFNEMLSAIRRQQAARDSATHALSEVNRRKDEFLAMLGHELRNPLSAIASATQVWRESSEDTQTTGQMRDVIQRQTTSLKRLVDDLLDVARIATGKIDLHTRPVRLGELIVHATEAMRPQLEARRHVLEISLADDPVFVNADPTRLEQIVGNLLANAAKYTPDGGRITILERREASEVTVTVSDNGIGIEPELLVGIFELFTQANPTFERSAGGLGIGLNLCRRLAELHGGSITACSDGPGRGARFTVRLPALHDAEVSTQSGPPLEAIAPVGVGHRILVVDDNEETALLLARLLTKRGHQVRTAFDGLTALVVSQEFKPEVFLLDIGLPGLDGYTLARRLKGEGFENALFVAISGFAQDRDRELSQEAGFAHHFSKPVDFDELARVLVAVG